MPTHLNITLSNLPTVKISTPTHAPAARVKNPLMDERMVVLLTLVYPSAAFMAQLAQNHSGQNMNARCAVSEVVRGASTGSTRGRCRPMSLREGRVRERDLLESPRLYSKGRVKGTL